jgi:hypothetical protein
MHFKEYDWDDETDHSWHEFMGIEETNRKEEFSLNILFRNG